MSAVVENVVLGEGVVEKVVKGKKEKPVKLQVKYERVYMSLFTVLNSFCIPSENEGDFVLKPEDMRKILDAVEFYNEDVAVQSSFIEENIFSKDNQKSCRKLMKAEKLQWKIDNGLIEKKKRASRAKAAPKEPKEKVVKEPKAKKAKKPVVEPVVEPVAEPVMESVAEPVAEPVVMEPVAVDSVVMEPVAVNEVKEKKQPVKRKPKKNTEIVEDKQLNM